MINSEIDIKSKFVEMCKLIFINGKGEFVFPIENLIYDQDYSEFLAHKDWSTLETKINNLVKLINENNSILEKDVETEIWYLV